MPNIKKPQRMRSRQRQKLLTAVSEPHRREGRASVDKGSEFSPSPGLCSAAKGNGPQQAPEAPDEKTVDTRSAGKGEKNK
jgi:hypothetical protein